MIRFNFHDPDTAEHRHVTYGLPAGGRVPQKGEGVVADGSDPDFPAGIYEVRHVTTHVGHRGPSLTVVDLQRIGRV